MRSVLYLYCNTKTCWNFLQKIILFLSKPITFINQFLSYYLYLTMFELVDIGQTFVWYISSLVLARLAGPSPESCWLTEVGVQTRLRTSTFYCWCYSTKSIWAGLQHNIWYLLAIYLVHFMLTRLRVNLVSHLFCFTFYHPFAEAFKTLSMVWFYNKSKITKTLVQ